MQLSAVMHVADEYHCHMNHQSPCHRTAGVSASNTSIRPCHMPELLNNRTMNTKGISMSVSFKNDDHVG